MLKFSDQWHIKKAYEYEDFHVHNFLFVHTFCDAFVDANLNCEECGLTVPKKLEEMAEFLFNFKY